MRVRMDVEYDGTNYCGWQRQKNATSVQQKLEDALGKLLGGHVIIHGRREGPMPGYTHDV